MAREIYRLEGYALSSAPLMPNTARTLDCYSNDSNDNGSLFLSGLDGSFGFILEYVSMSGQTHVQTVNKFRRVNRAYYYNKDVNMQDIPTSGTIYIEHPDGILDVILPGEVSAWSAKFSTWPGIYDISATAISGNISAIKHKRGQSPFNTTDVTDGYNAAGIGDFWVEGSGFVTLDLVR